MRNRSLVRSWPAVAGQVIRLAFIAWASLVDHFSSLSNNKNNSRNDAKVQRNDYHASIFLCALARKIIFICSGVIGQSRRFRVENSFCYWLPLQLIDVTLYYLAKFWFCTDTGDA